MCVVYSLTVRLREYESEDLHSHSYLADSRIGYSLEKAEEFYRY